MGKMQASGTSAYWLATVGWAECPVSTLHDYNFITTSENVNPELTYLILNNRVIGGKGLEKEA